MSFVTRSVNWVGRQVQGPPWLPVTLAMPKSRILNFIDTKK